MLLKIIAIGKLKDRGFQERCDEYAKWLRPYAKLEMRELPDSTPEKEGAAILKELEKDRNDNYIDDNSANNYLELLDKFSTSVDFYLLKCIDIKRSAWFLLAIFPLSLSSTNTSEFLVYTTLTSG